MFMGYSSGKIPESWVLGFALTCVLMETIHLNTACQVALQLQVGCKSIASQLQVNSQNDSLTIRSLPVSEVFVPSSGWTLNNTSNVFYNKAGLVEIELVFTASPIAQTGGRYMIGTFTKCAPYHALTVQCPIAAVDNAYLTNSVPAIVGNNINIDNFTGGNVANVRVHAIYFSTYVPS